MSTARERVQQEAARRFPNPAPGSCRQYPLDALRQFQRGGFTAGRTVTAEQIEQAARAITHPDVDPDRMGVIQTYDGGSTDCGWVNWRGDVIKAFTAAGFIVEEES